MLARGHLVALLAVLVIACGFSVYFYTQLPAEVPTHWNIHGEADQFGGKLQILLLGPGIIAGLGTLLWLLPKLGPFRRNLEASRVAYGRLTVALVAAFLAIHVVLLLKADGSHINIGRQLAIIFGTLFAVIGNWITRLRRNFWIGIRLPWTLASDQVWDKTHRLGGPLFVIVGVVTAVAGLFLSGPVCFWILIGGTLATVLFVTIYSIVLYGRLHQGEGVKTGSRR